MFKNIPIDLVYVINEYLDEHFRYLLKTICDDFLYECAKLNIPKMTPFLSLPESVVTDQTIKTLYHYRANYDVIKYFSKRIHKRVGRSGYCDVLSYIYGLHYSKFNDDKIHVWHYQNHSMILLGLIVSKNIYGIESFHKIMTLRRQININMCCDDMMEMDYNPFDNPKIDYNPLGDFKDVEYDINWSIGIMRTDEDYDFLEYMSSLEKKVRLLKINFPGDMCVVESPIREFIKWYKYIVYIELKLDPTDDIIYSTDKEDVEFMKQIFSSNNTDFDFEYFIDNTIDDDISLNILNHLVVTYNFNICGILCDISYLDIARKHFKIFELIVDQLNSYEIIIEHIDGYFERRAGGVFKDPEEFEPEYYNDIFLDTLKIIYNKFPLIIGMFTSPDETLKDNKIYLYSDNVREWLKEQKC
jgi:hypothetical protein